MGILKQYSNGKFYVAESYEHEYESYIKVGDSMMWVKTWDDQKRYKRARYKLLGSNSTGNGNITEQRKRYEAKYKDYELSWGGRYSGYECLLRIDPHLFD